MANFSTLELGNLVDYLMTQDEDIQTGANDAEQFYGGVVHFGDLPRSYSNTYDARAILETVLSHDDEMQVPNSASLTTLRRYGCYYDNTSNVPAPRAASVTWQGENEPRSFAFSCTGERGTDDKRTNATRRREQQAPYGQTQLEKWSCGNCAESEGWKAVAPGPNLTHTEDVKTGQHKPLCENCRFLANDLKSNGVSMIDAAQYDYLPEQGKGLVEPPRWHWRDGDLPPK